MKSFSLKLQSPGYLIIEAGEELKTTHCLKELQEEGISFMERRVLVDYSFNLSTLKLRAMRRVEREGRVKA